MPTTRMIMDFTNSNFLEPLRKLVGQILRDCIYKIFISFLAITFLLGALWFSILNLQKFYSDPKSIKYITIT